MSELIVSKESREEKKRILKELLKRIHAGEDMEKLKQEFLDVLRSTSPLEIPVIEQELVKEGISPHDIARMCDIHVDLFRESVAGSLEIEDIPPGHPLHTYYLENKEIMKDSEMLNLYARSLKDTESEEGKRKVLDVIKNLVNTMRLIGYTHYNKEEMLLFPYLERRGLTAVPTVLWTKHDDVRFELRALAGFVADAEKELTEENIEKVVSHATKTASDVMDIVFREENILYPTVKVLLDTGEWYAIRLEEDSIGHYKVKPAGDCKPEGVKPIYPHEVKKGISLDDIMNLPQHILQTVKGLATGDLTPDTSEIKRDGDIELHEGYMLPKEIDALFRTLPFDITFIDKDDRVRFFSGGHRIFARNKTILGRKVELCHPPKSVHIVKRILKAFKSGERDVAEFWIPFQGRFIHIRYFPVRDENGEYLGTVEVVQDVTDIKKLEGEKRLLDWK